LHENHAVNGIKAEFEAEGTRLEEALRLKEVVMKAELGLTLKIGGCEAMSDLYECRNIGVERIVAPMVESAFALRKFIGAVGLVFSKEEREDITIAINIETSQSYRNFDEILNIPEVKSLNGIVMGRVDMTGSMKMTRSDIDGDMILEMTRSLFKRSRKAGLENAVGGGVSAHSLPFFRYLMNDHLIDRFETRKVIFKCPEVFYAKPEDGLTKAVEFEIMWLKNKCQYYRAISLEDEERLEMLIKRYNILTEKVGDLVR
jgi:4-hydroxy-2-oxoheptanedioate aldolase